MRLLDLYCGAGGAAMGYYRAGFTEVVGIDIKPQPLYPFEFIQADCLRPPLDLSLFDLIHASPPCQAFSKTRALWPNSGHQDLIPATRELLVKSGVPYVIENVPGAPLVSPVMLCGLMFNLKVLRHRNFETPFFLLTPQHPKHNGGTNAHRGMSTGAEYVCVAGHNFLVHEAREAMGINWMGQKGLNQAIPPAYTEWIGRQIIAACKDRSKFTDRCRS